MNKRQAAIQAGYAPSTASIMAKRLTDRLSCNRIFIEEAQRQGLTIEAIIGEIKRGMTEGMHPQHPDQPDNFNRRALHWYCHIECQKCTKCELCRSFFPKRMDFQGYWIGHTVHIVTNARAKVCDLPPDIVNKIKS